MAGARAQLKSDPGAGGTVPLPDMIDRYKPLRHLATGGMAELFLAKQSGLEGFEKVVVIKRILSHLATDDEFVTMFLDEARIAAKLSHPNIVQIYDLGRADDSYYIAMEYVSGRNVQHLLTKEAERGQMSPVEHTCRILAGVCDGLHYAHSRKDYDGKALDIVHRDISPQNILVSFTGGVKLVDFGIAKASTQLAQTRAGVLKGKYAYMSPEQVRGAKVDHRSDIFSVGLVFYEMLTGHRAFERESSLKTLKAIVQEKPLNPKELNPEIPDEVIKLLSKALEKNPDRRYKNGQDMQLAIEDYLDSSKRKSNNVRLSRYMYELFDDELNAEGGTMVVDGIGEVIVPTGQKGELKPRVEDDVDHQTLSAALINPSPTAAGDDDEFSKSPTSASVGRRIAQPASRVVREETAAGEEDEPISMEVEDKTIPVYDLDENERRRFMSDGGASVKPAGRDPQMDSAATDEIDPSLIVGARKLAGKDLPSFVDDEETATVGPVQAASILAAVNARTMAPDGDSSLTREVGEGQVDSLTAAPGVPGWEAGTVEVSDASLDPMGLHSKESVIGSGGIIPSERGTVRPSAAPASGIRPAAAAGSAPVGRAPVTDAPPRDPTPVTRDQPPSPAPAPSAPDVSVGVVAAPTSVVKKQRLIAGFPAWMVMAAIAVAGFFVLGIIVMAGAVIYVVTDSGEAAGSAWVDVTLDISPPGASVVLDDDTELERELQLQAGTHTVKIEADGFEPFTGEFEIPEGDEPFTFSKALESLGEGSAPKKGKGKKKKRKRKRGKR